MDLSTQESHIDIEESPGVLAEWLYLDSYVVEHLHFWQVGISFASCGIILGCDTLGTSGSDEQMRWACVCLTAKQGHQIQ